MSLHMDLFFLNSCYVLVVKSDDMCILLKPRYFDLIEQKNA